MRDEQSYKLARMLSTCLQIAEAVDTNGEGEGKAFYDEWGLGLGYRALSGILREGVISVIRLQSRYHSAIANERYAKGRCEDMQEFLAEVFGDYEANTLNDEYKKQITTYVRSLLAGADMREDKQK